MDYMTIQYTTINGIHCNNEATQHALWYDITHTGAMEYQCCTPSDAVPSNTISMSCNAILRPHH